MSENERFKSLIAVYLMLINKNNEILLLRRRNTGYQDGSFGLIQGHLEEGESIKQGTIREAEEEVGIKIKYEDLDVIHVMHSHLDLDYMNIFLKTDKWEGEVMNKELDKCSELKWASFDDLLEKMVPEVAVAIENFKKNIFYDEIGW